ncbi:MAG TPA: hypothetical protein VLZ55_06315 [Rhodanobacter sp.]|nr:hypothetical protein [Rhodanobacter sp.]
MKIAFYLIAAAMIAAALATVVVPLLRAGRRSGRTRSTFATALVIALALPLGAAGVYLLVGTPAALNGTSAQPTSSLDIQQAVAELRAHLAQQPDDVAGWMLLAQTSSMLRNSADAREAFDHALKLAPNNADAMVGWAEADSILRADHMIEGRALDLLKRAVQLQPNSQRGLWMLGISDFQHARYRDAQATWRLLLPQLEPGSTVAKAVTEQIAVAGARAGDAPAPATTAAATDPTAAASAALHVQVALAPALATKLAKGDVLFVYARAAGAIPGPPLAVARLDASALPTSVTLTDAMAMSPQHQLSSATQVFVGARISHSGQPIAQPGDLEGNAGVVDVATSAPVKISIDTVR